MKTNIPTVGWVRVAAGAMIFCAVMPPVAAGGVGLGLSGWLASLCAVGVSLAASVWASARLREPLASAVRHAPVAGGAAALAGLVVLFPYARLSVFMADVTRSECAYRASDPFRLQHSCLSAYAEAARMAREGGRNIYEETAYQPRFIGPLKVDTYHYPPPFLLLPGAVEAVTGDFFDVRAVWFALQCVLFVAAALAVTRWIGDAPGGRAMLFLPLVLTAPSMLSGLQQGNFQVTAVSFAVLGLTLVASSRIESGSALLALTAVGKIFPGLMIVYLLAARRWRAVLWAALWGVALIGLTLAIFGPRPFVDFVRYEAPRINDGRAFPQTEAARTAAMNTGFYGITVKLRWLGVTALDAATGRTLTGIYGFALLAIAAIIGWRERAVRLDRPDDRLRAVTIWLALVGLASYRSPFVGFAYGAASTMWLLSLMAAGSSRPLAWLLGVVAFVVTYVVTVIVPSPGTALPPAWALWLSLGLQLAMFGVNATVIWFALTSKASAMEADSALTPELGLAAK